MNRRLRKLLSDNTAPPVLSYMQKKMAVTDLEKSLKAWERKVAVAEVSDSRLGVQDLVVCQLVTESQWSFICVCPPAATLGPNVLAPEPPGGHARVLWHWCHWCLAGSS